MNSDDQKELDRLIPIVNELAKAIQARDEILDRVNRLAEEAEREESHSFASVSESHSIGF